MATKIDLEGKKIIVTGAGRGMGRDISERLYQHGAIVFALSRTRSQLDDLKAKCPTVNIFAVDLANWDQTRKVVESIGLVDGIVNNAAVRVRGSLLDCKLEDYDIMWKTNVSAVLNICQVVAKGMIEAGTKGSIVNISSNLTTIGAPGISLYASTKAALERLTRSMSLEWGKHGIRANTVNPTLTNTHTEADLKGHEAVFKAYIGRTPLGRILEPEEITNAVIFLLSDLSEMISGDTLTVDGGYRWG